MDSNSTAESDQIPRSNDTALLVFLIFAFVGICYGFGQMCCGMFYECFIRKCMRKKRKRRVVYGQPEGPDNRIHQRFV
ncbi:hypothetical protein PRIPAC_97574 [Pristionchus pacificus]|uniref:Uncharacterized protein n=1 Tax=Pristionchus pacificus TaxID=54126 RepID=A0A2A6BJG7_PRIPA|nr:hypothetical protein PRIPAC_97574 [Pristionchus pacificus]|eukprot:PDM66064.1 hypothetical protein PRIPAC_45289 [Pristionchus pacificus]